MFINLLVVFSDLREVLRNSHQTLNISFDNKICVNKWRCAWKKAQSDVRSTTRFSFQFALYLLVKQKENLTLCQVSVRALFCAPLQIWHCNCTHYKILRRAKVRLRLTKLFLWGICLWEVRKKERSESYPLKIPMAAYSGIAAHENL